MAASLCSVSGCSQVIRAKGYCGKHYMRWHRFEDPLVTKVSHRFAGDAVTYSGAHIRVRRTKGLASIHDCACGAPARHWAYNHADPNEKRDERGRPYSPDPSYYEAMCVSCHKRSDLARVEVAS